MAPIKKYTHLFLTAIILGLLSLGCNQGSTGNGSLGFSLELSDDPAIACTPEQSKRNPLINALVKIFSPVPATAGIDCAGAGIETIVAWVYDSSGSVIAEGGPWACELHSEIIGSIPVGDNYRLLVNAMNPDGKIIYKGEKSPISVFQGQTTDAGVVPLLFLGTPDLSAEIIAPAPGSRFFKSQAIDFSGTGSDTLGNDYSGKSLTWISSIDNEIGTGTVISVSDLTPGTHTITLNVENESGDKARDTITITVLEILENSLGMEFQYIPQGTFSMGSPEDEMGRKNDETLHQVTLTAPFYIQTTEVTQKQWRMVMGTSPSVFSDCGDSCPVENISWVQVQEFIHHLNTMDLGIYRLPREAEWEYAARAGSTTAFSNGKITQLGCALYDTTLIQTGWYCANSSSPHPGGQKDSNDWNLFDIHGNVNEWCQDLYGPYPQGSTTDPAGPDMGENRIIRGGSWNTGSSPCRSAFRDEKSPAHGDSDIGFRLTWNPDGEISDKAPTAMISTPQDQAVVTLGTPIAFTGTALDHQNTPLSQGQAIWLSTINGYLGTGTSVSAAGLESGIHTITLMAIDLEGRTATDTITLTVNTLPEPFILTPSGNARFIENHEVLFTGNGEDQEDGTLDGESLVWTSDIDGRIGTGTEFSKSNLSLGKHAITLTVTDSHGAVASALTQITINPNQPPTVLIASPENATTMYYQEPILFSGTAIDPEDGILTGASLVWTSSINGQIGTGSSFSTDELDEGSHAITLTAMDSDKASGSDMIQITIDPLPVNGIPLASIQSPGDETTHNYGESITFSGTGIDPEDGSLTGDNLVWNSSIDGQIGTGTSFSTSGLAAGLSGGSHTITLTVTDSEGASDSDHISILIKTNQAPSAVINSPKDDTFFYVEETIYFSGTGTDPEDGTLTGNSLVWTSSLDGIIGTGTSFSTYYLSEGTHTITLTVTDSKGKTDRATIQVTSG